MAGHSITMPGSSKPKSTPKDQTKKMLKRKQQDLDKSKERKKRTKHSTNVDNKAGKSKKNKQKPTDNDNGNQSSQPRNRPAEPKPKEKISRVISIEAKIHNLTVNQHPRLCFGKCSRNCPNEAIARPDVYYIGRSFSTYSII